MQYAVNFVRINRTTMVAVFSYFTKDEIQTILSGVRDPGRHPDFADRTVNGVENTSIIEARWLFSTATPAFPVNDGDTTGGPLSIAVISAIYGGLHGDIRDAIREEANRLLLIKQGLNLDLNNGEELEGDTE